jgi:ADP-ribosyl-[dinitrogen reductase] hydrolase
VGDALGAPVEFDSWSQIQLRFGASGVRNYASAYGRPGAITDNTQMTLFTAEGLLRARNRLMDRGAAEVEAVLHRSYERWLLTQVQDPEQVPWDPDCGDSSNSGWLIRQAFLHDRRAPGATCISALGDSYRLATPDDPINHSKGSGGLRGMAPVGLVADEPFDLACRASALTHGHPTGWLAAGALAQLVAQAERGVPLRTALEVTTEQCRADRRGTEVVAALEQAMSLARQASHPTPARVESLGDGWVAEEALAISVFCSLTATDFREGVLSAVNHSGDSATTGALAGNLLGASLGIAGIDPDLVEGLEGRTVIQQVGNDLYHAFIDRAEPDPDRYPPW